MIHKELTFVNENLSNKDSVLNFIVSKSKKAGKITDEEKVLDALYERENIISTAVGNEIAMPHCKSPAVVEPFVFFVRTDQLIDWGEDKVKLIFSIILPDTANDNLHLQTLAKLSRSLVHEENINSLKIDNKKEVVNKLKTIIEEE